MTGRGADVPKLATKIRQGPPGSAARLMQRNPSPREDLNIKPITQSQVDLNSAVPQKYLKTDHLTLK